ncbi:MAG: undecaprenyl-diphosphate phosphatase [Bacillota bacterium]
MDILQAIVLGLVQGVTEFLPVSSSGHLVLLQNVMGVDSGSALFFFFDTMLHVGTLAAVVIVLRKDIAAILRQPFGKTMRLLVVATIPIVVMTLLFGDFFESTFGGKTLGIEFLITGVLLVLAEKLGNPTRKFSSARYSDALIMGVAQGIAVLPAVSRSGATMAGGLLTGLDRESVARFSFLMSVIAIFGSVVYQAKDVVTKGLGEIPWAPVIAGTVMAALSGILAVRFMLNFIKRHKLYGFAAYVFIVGALVLLDQNVFHLVFK